MPLPAPAPPISNIRVVGRPIATDALQTYRPRFSPANLQAGDAYVMEKRADQTCEFVVNWSSEKDSDEAFISAYAWSSLPAELVVASVRFTDNAVLVNVSGGLNGVIYVLSLHAQTQFGRAFKQEINIDVSGSASTAPLVPTDTARPRLAYLLDVLSVPVPPAYTDVLLAPLSVALP